MVGPAAKREGVAHLQDDRPVRTAGLLHRRRRSQDGPLPVCRPPDTELRIDCAISPISGALRLSAAVRPAASGWRAVRDQSGLPALSGGRPYRAQAPGAAAGRRDAGADPGRGQPNARWSLDFVHDQFACGRRFRILNIVDDVTRECLAAIPDTSISGRRVARELTALINGAASPE